jgi:hypothetical protein
MPLDHQDRHFNQLARDRTCASNPKFLELICKLGFHFREARICLDFRSFANKQCEVPLKKKLSIKCLGSEKRPLHKSLTTKVMHCLSANHDDDIVSRIPGSSDVRRPGRGQLAVFPSGRRRTRSTRMTKIWALSPRALKNSQPIWQPPDETQGI